ncbi:phosphatase PAP2-related protein [Pedobacter sp. JCM 36344]|uniref:phosphatase PAP2-related protein n=1 Tax=Pedobacter sp. JCM 36344 TaxID=3374280 RepID=UPI0039793D86
MRAKQYSWELAWSYPTFRTKFILGTVILIGILLFIPTFFTNIEDREGIVLHDWLLKYIPSIDVSLLIFLVLYATVIMFLVRMSMNTEICLKTLWSFIFLCLFRMVTIKMVALNPPHGLIELVDPCSIVFYRSNVITKDLFFSGHTAILILGGICMSRPKDKIIAFSAAFIIGILLLLQHVHYTVDVLAAPFFSMICCFLGKSVAKIS